ncbi:hypothetical protein NDU88_007939 [Pleurodeles waltl]|uniref:Uncharacterized protein n=1 Tax=Pleurodeles waltl TaxID=8319 RepID=A0AAV7NXP5_PLEWA|nr:hypothetical protein NDU88_007939 [Pleurodeles waltl]
MTTRTSKKWTAHVKILEADVEKRQAEKITAKDAKRKSLKVNKLSKGSEAKTLEKQKHTRQPQCQRKLRSKVGCEQKKPTVLSHRTLMKAKC